MNCTSCEYNNCCSIQAIAPDITGCTGHSKERKLKDNECMCISCKSIFLYKEDGTIKYIFPKKDNRNLGLCFNCY